MHLFYQLLLTLKIKVNCNHPKINGFLLNFTVVNYCLKKLAVNVNLALQF